MEDRYYFCLYTFSLDLLKPVWLEMSLTFDQFVKNLSPSQINLSAIRGEGELTDLELNEVVIGKTVAHRFKFWDRLYMVVVENIY